MHIKKYVHIMKAEGVNQGELARRLGISPTVLSDILRGRKHGLTIPIAVRIKTGSGGMVSDVEDFYIEKTVIESEGDTAGDGDITRMFHVDNHGDITHDGRI